MTMVRKQVYLKPGQEARVKQLAAILHITEAEVIHQAIDQHEIIQLRGRRDPGAWEREREFMKQWMARGTTPGGRNWKREDVYEERLARYER